MSKTQIDTNKYLNVSDYDIIYESEINEYLYKIIRYSGKIYRLEEQLEKTTKKEKLEIIRIKIFKCCEIILEHIGYLYILQNQDKLNFKEDLKEIIENKQGKAYKLIKKKNRKNLKSSIVY